VTSDRLLERLEAIEERYKALDQEMAAPEALADRARLQGLAREQSALAEVAQKYAAFKGVTRELEEARLLAQSDDAELAKLAEEEMEGLRVRREVLAQEIRLALIPPDPRDARDVIVEIRAGTGGEEAGLFAADLYRMYHRYAETRGWKVEVISANGSGVGGFREIVFEVAGRGAYSRLKHESGVHRVQRVPLTEASGRIHTSTATVAVLAEADEVEVNLAPDDLRTDIFHASSAGGQNVNKVSTAVRLTHLPTGIVVVCQDERSQQKNRLKAMAVLRARLLEQEQRKQQAAVVQERRSQVGTGERSEKIRTYNFPQDRLTDHRIGLTRHNLPAILNGEIDDVIDAVATAERTRQLEEQSV